MDFDLAQPVADAVRAAVAAGDCGYGYSGGLGEAFAAFAQTRLRWSPDPSQVYAIPDVMTGIAEAIEAITPRRSGVVINPPVYPPFFYRLRLAGRRIVEAPLRRGSDGRYDLDFEALDQALATDGVRAYLLCSPHNPTGRVWSASQLAAVADMCERRGVTVLVDEIHAPLALPGVEHVPFLSLDHEVTGRSVTFTSASKAWNIPGLKCGIAVSGGPALATALQERWEALIPGQLGVIGSAAAFTLSLPWLDALLAQLDENRSLLARLLREHLPAVGYVPPEASFLAWLDCRELGLGDDPAAAFLSRGKVALSPGPGFGAQGRGFARLNIGTSPDLITEAVRRMTAALAVA
jgi:cystathionine beta-lyase